MTAERLRALSDDELGRALASVVDWPETPDLGSSVTAAIRATERAATPIRPRLSLPSRRRTIAILVAAFLVIAAAAVATKLVIDFGAVVIKVAPSGEPLPSPVLRGPSLGTVTTLEGAAEAAFPPVVPSRIGPPDEVWVDIGGQSDRVIIGWRPTSELPAIDELPWGAMLTEFKGDTLLAVKSIPIDAGQASLRSVRVNGEQAYWVTGEHTLELLTDDGHYERYRVTGHVLLWQDGDLTLRLETSLGLKDALAIAEST